MPERRRIYLLRHGDVSYFGPKGFDDPPLNDRGVSQAQAMGVLLAGVPIDTVMTSGLTRTVQTATLAQGDRGLPLETFTPWEEAKTGNFEGLDSPETMEQAVRNAFANAQDDDARFMTGELYAELRQRVVNGMHTLLARKDWNDLLFAAHGVVNRVILAHALGVDGRVYKRMEQDSGCLNILDIDDDADGGPEVAYVRLMNFTPERPAKLGMKYTTLEHLWRQFSE